MKKIYNNPTITVVKIQHAAALLIGSDIKEGNASNEKDVLSRRGGYFDDDWEDEDFE